MLRRMSFLALVLSLCNVSFADASKPKDEGSAQAPKVTVPGSKELAEAVNGSFYHPDNLSGIQCSVVVNWSDFFKALKVSVPEARMHAIDGLQIQSIAIRGKTPELTFSWLNGAPDTKDQLEDGIRQIVGGFYQTYWSLLASTPIPRPDEISRIERQPDGTTRIYESDTNNKVDIELDHQNTPTRYTFDTPASKGSFDLRFVDSPKPTAGDLRRMSEAHIVVNVGASAFDVIIHLDYQPVDGFFVPGHFSYDVVGAYSVSLEFTGCSSIKPPPLPTSPNQ